MSIFKELKDSFMTGWNHEAPKITRVEVEVVPQSTFTIQGARTILNELLLEAKELSLMAPSFDRAEDETALLEDLNQILDETMTLSKIEREEIVFKVEVIKGYLK